MRIKMRYSAAERMTLLKRAEVLIAEGATIESTALQVGVRYSTLYSWRRRYNGLSHAGVDRLRRLEKENARLRRALLDLEPSHLALRPGKAAR